MNIKPISNFLNSLLKNTLPKNPADNRLFVFDFSFFGITILFLEIETSGPKIKSFFQTPENVSTDEEKLKTAADYVNSLGLKDKPRAVVNWGDGVTFRQMTLPPLPAEDLKQALAWDLKKKFFFNPEESLLGFQEVMNLAGPESAEKLLSAFYCEKKTAGAKLQWLEDMGFEIQSLVPWQAALARFLAAASQDTEHDVSVCDISERAARILIVRQAKVMLSRQVSLEGGKASLSSETLGKIAEEVKKSVEFYESQKYSKPVSKLVFTGVLTDPAGLEGFMGKNFEIKLIFPNAAPFISPSLGEEKKKFIAEHGWVFAPALGAALVQEGGLNLVPDEIRRRNAQKKNEKLLQTAWIGAAVILCLLLLVMWLRVVALGARIKSMDREWEKIQSSKKFLEDIAFRENVRHGAMKNDLAYAALLRELGRLTPSVFALQEARFSRPGGLLVLTGESYESGKENLKLTTKFVNTLSESPFFKNVTLVGTTQETKEQKFHFEIHCVLKGVT